MIARASSVTYSHTTKRPQAVAEELAVRYPLHRNGAWARQGRGTVSEEAPNCGKFARGTVQRPSGSNRSTRL